MIPWYQQGTVNLNAYAQPNYMLPINLFGIETSPLKTQSLYFHNDQRQKPRPHFQIEAQIYHQRSLADHEADEFSEYIGSEHASKTPQTKPRVFPSERFEPKQDAIKLNRAMEGRGTNEEQIINIITKRSLEQRLVIAAIYKEMFGSDLSHDLRDETSGNFRRLLLALMTPLYQYYAKELRDAMSGVGTNEDVLIEVLVTLSNSEMEQVKKAYHNMYRVHLEEDIRDETSGHFKDLLISLGDRTDDSDVNTPKAKEQARRLHRAGELRLGTDESEFISLLCTQSFAQLNEVFFQYQAMTQHDIEDVIIAEFSGDTKNALKTIVKVVRNKPLYFAEALYNAMKGVGTNNKKLIRILVTHAEHDLGDIAKAFRMKYGSKLEIYIRSDTSGDYRKALLSLLGMPQHTMAGSIHDLFLHEPESHVTGVVQDSVTDQKLNLLAHKAITSATQQQSKRKDKGTSRGGNYKDKTFNNANPSVNDSLEDIIRYKDINKNSNFSEILSYLPKITNSTEPSSIPKNKKKNRRKHKKVKIKNKRRRKKSKKTKTHTKKLHSKSSKASNYNDDF